MRLIRSSTVIAAGCFLAVTGCATLPDPDTGEKYIQIGRQLLRAVFGSGGSDASRPSSWNGTLASGDSVLPEDNSFYDEYPIQMDAGESVVIDMRSSDFDSYLIVTGSSGQVVATDDDSGGGYNARLTYTAPARGTYRVLANSLEAGDTGSYQLTVTPSR